MRMDISELLQESGNRKSLSETWASDDLDLEDDLYSLGDSLEVSLLLYNASGIIELEGSYSGILQYHCNRCLTEIRDQLNDTLDAQFYRPDRDLSSVEEDIERDDIYLRNYSADETIDVGALIREDIVLNRPMQVLCQPDCKGLCPVCGQNLNESDCGHDTESTDPRLSKLQDINLTEENEAQGES